jgi:hypothetical protein
MSIHTHSTAYSINTSLHSLHIPSSYNQHKSEQPRPLYDSTILSPMSTFNYISPSTSHLSRCLIHTNIKQDGRAHYKPQSSHQSNKYTLPYISPQNRTAVRGTANISQTISIKNTFPILWPRNGFPLVVHIPTLNLCHIISHKPSPSMYTPHTCQQDTEFVTPLIDATAIHQSCKTHTQFTPYPITISINNTLPIHINTKQKRPSLLLMKQPSQSLFQFILKLFISIFLHQHLSLTQTQSGHIQPSLSPSNSYTNSLIFYEGTCQHINHNHPSIFMTQPSLSLPIHIQTTSIHHISNQYTNTRP